MKGGKPGFFPLLTYLVTYLLTYLLSQHYMKGGKPGFFPPLDNFPHPCPLNLWDPANVTKKLSAAEKVRSTKSLSY